MERSVIRKSGKYSQVIEDSSLGWSIAVAVGIGLYFGQMYDKNNDSEPLGTLIGFLIGLGAACRLVLKVYKRLNSWFMESLFLFETVNQDSLFDSYRPKIFSGLLGFLIFYSWVPISFFVKNNIKNINQKFLRTISFLHFFLASFLMIFYKNLIVQKDSFLFFIIGSIFGLVKMVKKLKKTD